jgi:hypothetical protein
MIKFNLVVPSTISLLRTYRKGLKELGIKDSRRIHVGRKSLGSSAIVLTTFQGRTPGIHPSVRRIAKEAYIYLIEI